MPAFYVYLLKCIQKNGDVSLYTGSTQDLMKRVQLHQTGKGAKYTRGKDIELVYYEMLISRSDAMKREYEIKNFSTKQKWDIVRDFQEKIASGREAIRS